MAFFQFFYVRTVTVLLASSAVSANFLNLGFSLLPRVFVMRFKPGLYQKKEKLVFFYFWCAKPHKGAKSAARSCFFESKS